MKLALCELPSCASLKGRKTPIELSLNGSDYGVLSCPYIKRAYDGGCQLGWSRKPVIEFCIPSLLDDTLAPKGSHVMSLFCQNFQRLLPDGPSWDDPRDTDAITLIHSIVE